MQSTWNERTELYKKKGNKRERQKWEKTQSWKVQQRCTYRVNTLLWLCPQMCLYETNTLWSYMLFGKKKNCSVIHMESAVVTHQHIWYLSLFVWLNFMFLMLYLYLRFFIVFIDTNILFTRTAKLRAHPTRVLIDVRGTCKGYRVGRMGKTKNEWRQNPWNDFPGEFRYRVSWSQQKKKKMEKRGQGKKHF